MKLLLHTCCAPCLIHPLEQLKMSGFQVAGFFYNPNIHPFTEYKDRKQAVMDFVKQANIEMIYPEYNPAEFFQATNLIELRPERCPICWYLRMKRTARIAKEQGFEYFSTTLLVSPYQDVEALNRIGNDISKEENINFYYQDFREGFKNSHNLAKRKGIYMQKYCGCLYSELERCRESVKQ